ncbi:Cadherin-related tumor suppressor [Brachionus plicatilis]|uniref:Cadherin-related tumor suppressor n=1 Tax=Brachionus plicatilis TaxID=10195 RepID=A0A3M7T4W9_BRAPC|nr:Cadherin-related tumor suppressor [Brachionus plicatilis]
MKDLSPCAKLPCRNPAECENMTNGSFVCHCKAGTRGKYCEKLLENGDQLCKSSPCWYGGICVGNKTHWKCICPQNRTGLNCKGFVTKDLIVKVKNKGFYLAKTTLIFRQLTSKVFNRMNKVISMGQEHVFEMPADTDLSSSYLVVHAIAGTRVMTVKINSNPSCFHVWGTTLYPVWSYIDCE